MVGRSGFEHLFLGRESNEEQLASALEIVGFLEGARCIREARTMLGSAGDALDAQETVDAFDPTESSAWRALEARVVKETQETEKIFRAFVEGNLSAFE